MMWSLSLRFKLVVIVVFVALVPLAISAFTALAMHREALDDTLAEIEASTARHAARVAQGWLDQVERNLTTVASGIPWPDLSNEELQGALSMVYGQVSWVAAVALVDEQGRGRGPTVFVAPGDPNQPEHPHLSVDALTALARHIPTSPAVGARAGYGQAFVATGGEAGNPDDTVPMALAPLIIPVSGARAQWALVIGVSLGGICAALAESATLDIELALFDDRGRRVCPSGGRPLSPMAPAMAEQLAEKLSVQKQPRIQYQHDNGAAMFATWAKTSSDWTVLASQPVARALAPSRDLERQTWYWISLSLIVALVAGLYLSRGITRPVSQLTEGSRELAAGNFDHRLDVVGGDEMAELARAFNQMRQELSRRDQEIQTWNRELEERVTLRTRELSEAQEQLLQSRKIAGLSSLAAGVAHEINNPLTTVLGMAQMLKRWSRREVPIERQMTALSHIESSARRIRDIVQVLQSLSNDAAGRGFSRIDGQDVVAEAVEMARDEIAAKGIELQCNYSAVELPLRGNATQLREVLTQLLRNALAATDMGGAIKVSTDLIADKLIKITVSDTGKGIAPEHLERIFEPFFTTKEDWQGRGLGLTVSHRIVENHGGAIKVHSKLGSGTTFALTLSADSGEAHLV